MRPNWGMPVSQASDTITADLPENGVQKTVPKWQQFSADEIE